MSPSVLPKDIKNCVRAIDPILAKISELILDFEQSSPDGVRDA